jgi:hypothetical protein
MFEDRIDDVILVPEMVIQVPGRDVHLFRDDGRRDVRFAEFVEQPERELEDAFAGPARSFLLHG